MENRTHIQLNTGNISDYIYSIAKQFPDKPAVLHPYTISYKEFQTEIDHFVLGLTRIGLKKGHKVLLLVKPSPQMFILTFSIIRMGAIPVMIDPGMGHKAMIKAFSKLKIDMFIGEPIAHILRIIYPGAFKNITTYVTSGRPLFGYAHSLSSFRLAEWKESQSVASKPTDEAAIFFTSGSTGPAKAVLYKNSMLHAQIDILRNHFKYSADEIDCCTFPLIGLLVMGLGLSVVFADMNMTKPAELKPEKLIRNIQDYNCSHLFCSPMVLRKLAEYGNKHKIKLPSIKRVMTAGAAVPAGLLQDFRKMLTDTAEIHTPYGATEALPISDMNDRELLELYSNPKVNNEGVCIGYPIGGAEIKIIEINDYEIPAFEKVNELPDNKVGEIIVKGPVVTQEYLGMELLHYSKIWDPKSNIYWHRMGDLARKDDKGRIWFYGRKSQRVQTKDGILYTIPVEAFFNAHPKVRRSALIGIAETGTKFKLPMICIQLEGAVNKNKKRQITQELLEIAKNHDISVKSFLFYKDFPVDPRHNAKIFREKLTKWAQK